jgi:hypothetical protein
MEAWCSGKIREFAEEERSYLGTLGLTRDETAKLDRLLDSSLGRSDIILVVALASLRTYHPLASDGERTDLLEKALALVEGSPARTG